MKKYIPNIKYVINTIIYILDSFLLIHKFNMIALILFKKVNFISKKN